MSAPASQPAPGPRSTPPRVLVVIPTYNEAANLPELVERLLALPVEGLEALVVDDASPDGTAAVAEELGRRYGGRVAVLRRERKAGLGPAYVAGFQEALRRGAAVVVQMDADLSHPPEAVPDMLALLDRYDVVVGSRWAPGGAVDERWGAARALLSRAGSAYARLVLGLRVRDATTGFKCLRRAALEALDLRALGAAGFVFQIEVAYACQRLGLRVGELPIRFAQRRRGRSKLSLAIVAEALWRVPALRLRGAGPA